MVTSKIAHKEDSKGNIFLWKIIPRVRVSMILYVRSKFNKPFVLF